jgi:hypothetical protein
MMAEYEDPDLEAGDDTGSKSSKKRTHNQLGTAMGDGLERPMGSKAAKKLKKEEMSSATFASTKATSMEMLTGSTAKMASALAAKGRHDTWMKQANFYAKVGNMAKAQEFMDKIEADQAKLEREEAAKEEALKAVQATTKDDSMTDDSVRVPVKNISVLKPATKDTEEEAEEVSRTSSGAIKQKDLDYDTEEEDGGVEDGGGEDEFEQVESNSG